MAAKAIQAPMASGAARVVVAQDGLQVLEAKDVATGLGIAEGAARSLIRDRKLRLTGSEGAVACQASSDGTRL